MLIGPARYSDAFHIVNNIIKAMVENANIVVLSLPRPEALRVIECVLFYSFIFRFRSDRMYLNFTEIKLI